MREQPATWPGRLEEEHFLAHQWKDTMKLNDKQHANSQHESQDDKFLIRLIQWPFQKSFGICFYHRLNWNYYICEDDFHRNKDRKSKWRHLHSFDIDHWLASFWNSDTDNRETDFQLDRYQLGSTWLQWSILLHRFHIRQGAVIRRDGDGVWAGAVTLSQRCFRAPGSSNGWNHS